MPDITYAEQFVIDGKQALISLRKFYDTVLVTNEDRRDHVIRIPIGDLFLNYREQLADSVILYQLPTSHLYQPKRLSEELYGTTEMWISLMRLNGMRNVTEFNRRLIKVYDPNTVRELIDLFLKREGKLS